MVLKFGGTEAAAAILKIRGGVLAHYLDGKAPVPDAVLLHALDLLLEEIHGPPLPRDFASVNPK